MDPTYASVNQKARVQMESEAVVLDKDFRTGESVNMANVITREDLRTTRGGIADLQLRKSTSAVIAAVYGMGSIL